MLRLVVIATVLCSLYLAHIFANDDFDLDIDDDMGTARQNPVYRRRSGMPKSGRRGGKRRSSTFFDELSANANSLDRDFGSLISTIAKSEKFQPKAVGSGLVDLEDEPDEYGTQIAESSSRFSTVGSGLIDLTRNLGALGKLQPKAGGVGSKQCNQCGEALKPINIGYQPHKCKSTGGNVQATSVGTHFGAGGAGFGIPVNKCKNPGGNVQATSVGTHFGAVGTHYGAGGNVQATSVGTHFGAGGAGFGIPVNKCKNPAGDLDACEVYCRKVYDTHLDRRVCVAGCRARWRFVQCIQKCENNPRNRDRCLVRCCRNQGRAELYFTVCEFCKTNFGNTWRYQPCIDFADTVFPTDCIRPSRSAAYAAELHRRTALSLT